MFFRGFLCRFENLARRLLLGYCPVGGIPIPGEEAAAPEEDGGKRCCHPSGLRLQQTSRDG